jgi:hypothetical protein
MLGLFNRSQEREGADSPAPDAPRVIEAGSIPPFDLAAHLKAREGFPMLDWDAARRWIGGLGEPEQKAAAWAACERGWLLHLRDALGKGYRLDESRGAAIVSSLEARLAKSTLEFMERTLKRIVHVLDGVAHVPEWGKDILVVFDDNDVYYRYAAQFYPERGEFAFSSGMHISGGCSHFITTKSDLRTIEPVIAHEMTHACLDHLRLPLWLNEGLAVNTEHRLTGAGGPLYTPREMHLKHLAFWGEAEIQEFWSGDAFRRTDDGNMLSYDLGKLLVEHISNDWLRFRDFVLKAHSDDAGAAAAREHLGVSLGSLVTAMLDKQEGGDWEPRPQRWKHLETRTE